MAKPDLWSCVKFKRLCRDLHLPRPYIVGLLETLWQASYATADPYIGPSEDVECAAEWPGKKGELTDALAAAGFIDRDGDSFYIHDLQDHAPDYVCKRIQRRIDKGLRAKTADNGGQRRTTAENGKSETKNGALPTHPPTHPPTYINPPIPPTITPPATASSTQKGIVDSGGSDAHAPPAATAPPDPPHVNGKKPSKPRDPDPIWDTIAEIFYGGPVPTGQVKSVSGIVRDLKELHATPAKILGHVKRMKKKWGPGITVTMYAIVKHWAAFTEEACEEDRDREINDFCGES